MNQKLDWFPVLIPPVPNGVILTFVPFVVTPAVPRNTITFVAPDGKVVATIVNLEEPKG